MIVKVKILSKCSRCDSQAYLPAGEAVDTMGDKYMCYLPCPKCHGGGFESKWIKLAEFQQLLQYPYEHFTQRRASLLGW